MSANKTGMLFAKKKSLIEIINSVTSTFTSERDLESYTLIPPKPSTGREIEISSKYNGLDDKITELRLGTKGSGERNFPTNEELYHLALAFGNCNRYFDMRLIRESVNEEIRSEHKPIEKYMALKRSSQNVNSRYLPTMLDLYGKHDNKSLFLRSNNKNGDHSWQLLLVETRPMLFANLRMKAINEYFEKYLAQDIPCSEWEISWTS